MEESAHVEWTLETIKTAFQEYTKLHTDILKDNNSKQITIKDYENTTQT